MSTLFEKLGITYREEEGLFYPNIAIKEETGPTMTGKYGDIWMQYIKESRPDYFWHLRRMGLVREKAAEVNEEAYELLYQVMEKYLATHIPKDKYSTLENWKLREKAKQVAEEIVLYEVVYSFF